MRHRDYRRRRQLYGGPWQQAIPDGAPAPRHGETLARYLDRTHVTMRTKAPYCLVCSTMGLMTPIGRGWRCDGRGDHFGRPGCGNVIGRDLRPLAAAGAGYKPDPRNITRQLRVYQIEALARMRAAQGEKIEIEPGAGKVCRYVVTCDEVTEGLKAYAEEKGAAILQAGLPLGPERATLKTSGD